VSGNGRPGVSGGRLQGEVCPQKNMVELISGRGGGGDRPRNDESNGSPMRGKEQRIVEWE